MGYDNSSFYGDMICDEYDDENNFMNPKSSAGYYIYHILGDGFDLMSEQCTQFMNDTNILTANTKGLDNFWGASYNLPRPLLNNSRKLSDEEYKIYLYLRNCRLLTREDIELAMNKCFALDNYLVYFSEETEYMNVVDHTNYESKETVMSNLARNDNDSTINHITDFMHDDTVEVLQSGISTRKEVTHIVNIPNQGWDKDFLLLLEQFICVKGDLKIREYQL